MRNFAFFNNITDIFEVNHQYPLNVSHGDESDQSDESDGGIHIDDFGMIVLFFCVSLTVLMIICHTCKYLWRKNTLDTTM